MSHHRGRFLANAVMTSAATLMLVSTTWAKPKPTAEDVCLGKQYNAYSNCTAAGISANYCADIARRTYVNCMERLGRTPSPPIPQSAGVNGSSSTPTPPPSIKSMTSLTVGSARPGATASSPTVLQPAAGKSMASFSTVDAHGGVNAWIHPSPPPVANPVVHYRVSFEPKFSAKPSGFNPEPMRTTVAHSNVDAQHAQQSSIRSAGKHDRKR